MMFSKSCEYGLRAVIYLCMESKAGSKLNIKEIANKIGTPEPFTAKILQTLARKGVVSSQKGPGGGFFIDPETKPISVMTVVEAIDGSDAFDQCAMGITNCSDEHPCPLHAEYKGYNTKLKAAMTNKTIQELAEGVKEKKFFLVSTDSELILA